jgi:UDP-N-acetylglucosamine 1-carboxyvinyltransferase
MDILKIKGGVPLSGNVKAAGAKNAVTKLLVASLLSDKRCVFFNVPNIADVEITVDLCKEIGSDVHWDKKEGVIEIVTKELKSTYVPQRFSGSNRIPILMIGALLGRTDEDIIVPTAGGCKIGKRPIDFHVSALEKLGATIEYRQMKKEEPISQELIKACKEPLSNFLFLLWVPLKIPSLPLAEQKEQQSLKMQQSNQKLSTSFFSSKNSA